MTTLTPGKYRIKCDPYHSEGAGVCRYLRRGDVVVVQPGDIVADSAGDVRAMAPDGTGPYYIAAECLTPEPRPYSSGGYLGSFGGVRVGYLDSTAVAKDDGKREGVDLAVEARRFADRLWEADRDTDAYAEIVRELALRLGGLK